jgi:hypothetical protein
MVVLPIPISPMQRRSVPPAEGHGPGATGFVHRRLDRDVPGGDLEREVEHLEAEVVGGADLVDGGSPPGEVRDHLFGHRRGIGGHAAGGDAVIAGEDGDHRAVDRGGRPALPGGEPLHDLLQAAERAGRLGEHRVPRLHGRDGGEVGSGHAPHEGPDIVEGNGRGRVHAAVTFPVGPAAILGRREPRFYNSRSKSRKPGGNRDAP